MKTGVSTSPCASSSVAARAAPSVAWTVNFTAINVGARERTAGSLPLPLAGEGGGEGKPRGSERSWRLLQIFFPLLAPTGFVEGTNACESGGIADDDARPLDEFVELAARLRGRFARSSSTRRVPAAHCDASATQAICAARGVRLIAL